MIRLEQLAEAAINQDAFLLRSLTQDFVRDRPTLKNVPLPDVADSRVMAAAASLVELLAARSHQEPPAWTGTIGASPEPIYLVKAAASMKHLRELCEEQSPEPLRKRGFYAPPNFLESA